MTLLASVASMFCSLSLSVAAPSVAEGPVENVKVAVITPIAESTAVVDDEAQFSDVVEFADDAADLGDDSQPAPDKVVLASEDDFLPADIFTDADDLLPADVVTADEDILPADVVVDAELEILPADVVTDLEIEVASALGFPGDFAGEAGLPVELRVDEIGTDREPGEPTAAPVDESTSSDDGSNGEAAS